MTTTQIFQAAAVLLCGLSAGLFYGYDCSVIRGLGQLSDPEYLKSFQAINRAILNPYFFASFMGSLILLPIATWLIFRQETVFPAVFMLVATLLYAVGVFGVTIAGNVPLNDLLDGTDLNTVSAEALHTFREKFEGRWNVFHHIRTWAGILAFLSAVLSLFRKA